MPVVAIMRRRPVAAIINQEAKESTDMKLEDLDLEHIAELLHVTEKCRLHPNLKPIHDLCLQRLHEIANPPPVTEERRVPRYEAPAPSVEARRDRVDEALRHEPSRFNEPSHSPSSA